MFGWFKKKRPGEKFAEGLYRAVFTGFDYAEDPGREVRFTARQTLNRGNGDCDEYAETFWYEMLKALELSPRVIHGYVQGAYHSAVECEICGHVYVFCNYAGRLMDASDYYSRYMKSPRYISDEMVKARKRVFGVDEA